MIDKNPTASRAFYVTDPVTTTFTAGPAPLMTYRFTSEPDPKITELDEPPPDAEDAPEPKNDVVPAPTPAEEDQP